MSVHNAFDDCDECAELGAECPTCRGERVKAAADLVKQVAGHGSDLEETWFATDPQCERISDNWTASTPEAAAALYFADSDNHGRAICDVFRKPFALEAADQLIPQDLGHDVLERLGDYVNDNYGEQFEDWPNYTFGKLSEKQQLFNKRIRGVVFDYLVATGDIGEKAPWTPIEEVTFKWVDGKMVGK